MKKILTASLVAMMAVTAANANIASTEYIADKVLGGDLSTLSTTEKKVVPAINELKTAVTDAGSAASGALAEAKTELEGKITAEKEAREAADTTLDGKITALDTKTTNALALKEDIANRVVVDGDIVEGKENSQYPTIAYLELTTKNITDGVAGNLSEMEQSILDLEGELDTAVETLEQADTDNLQTAKDYADSQDAAQTTTITNAYTNAIATAKTGAETTAMNYTDAEIAKINSADTGILKQAKDYTDAEVKELADGTVASNTAAINAINNETTGILAQANKHSDDADTAQTTALRQYADQAEADAIAAAKTETTTQVNALANGAVKTNTDAISALEESLADGGATDARFDAVEQTANAAQVKSTADFQFGAKDGAWKDITTLPAYCGKVDATCSLVSKDGVIQWELVSY